VRVSVVAGGDEEFVAGAEVQAACVMTAFLPLFLKFQQQLFAGQIEQAVANGESADVLAGEFGG